MYFTNWFVVAWLYVFILFSFIEVLKIDNKSYLRLVFNLSYVVGIELLCRIAKTSPYIPYEFAKYYFLLFLLIYFLTRPIKNVSAGLLIILLCLPAIGFIPVDQFRINFINSFAGIFTTGLVAYVLINRKLSIVHLKLISTLIAYGLIAILTSVIVKAPDLSEVDFGLGANFDTSADFGSNQVSTVMGLGTLIIGLSLLIRTTVFKPLALNLGLLLTFIVRGLLTFSRGGILGGVVSLIAVYFLSNKSKGFLYKPKFIPLVFVLILVAGGFYYVNEMTNQALLERYKGETLATKKGVREVNLETITSKRSVIALAEWNIFLTNPILGVGPGAGNEAREELLGVKIASHTEVTRLLAEQGIPGVIIAIIFLFYPIRKFMRSTNSLDRALTVAFFTFAIFTSLHAAMRTVITPFFWGLACANFIPSSNWLKSRKINYTTPEVSNSNI